MNNFTFVDIDNDIKDKTYSYTYVFTMKSFFVRKYFKIQFKSTLPHYVFTDIWHVLKIKLKEENKFIEDVIESNEPTDLVIGQLYIEPFTNSDKIEFTTDETKWKVLLDKALLKQNKLKKEYELLHDGYPNLNLPLR